MALAAPAPWQVANPARIRSQAGPADRARLFEAPQAWPAWLIPAVLASLPLARTGLGLLRVWRLEREDAERALSARLAAIAPPPAAARCAARGSRASFAVSERGW